MSNHDGHLPPDAQSERTRWEMWAILAIVAAVLIGSFAWRAIGHHPALRNKTDWTLSNRAGTRVTTTRVVATPAAVAPPRAP